MEATLLKSATQANELAERVRERVQRSNLAHGAFFMTEADLAAEYNVSRSVAREAVGRLKALGILESRKRKGLLVCRPDPLSLMVETLPSLVASQADWRELGMLRFALEVGSIELAVQNATDEQISELGQTADRLEAACRNEDQDASVAIDLEFHTLILKMTGSRMIAGMRQLLVDFFQRVPIAEVEEGTTDQNIWQHRELYNAIRARDIERARSMIRIQAAEWFVFRQ